MEVMGECTERDRRASGASEIRQELEAYADPVKREYLPRFFKTGKGEYGEGDKFLGVVVPNTRQVAKRHKGEPFGVMADLLQSEWHECRLCALLMLVERFKKSDEKGRKEIYDFYLSQTSRINNWDLVDLSAPGIVGEYLKDKPRDDLYRLADSPLLWDRRIAVVSTYTLIKNNDFIDILRLSEKFVAQGVAHSLAHIPAHGAHVPVHDAHVPAHDAQASVHDAHVPAHDAHVSAHDAHVPAHDAHVPAHDAHILVHDAHIPAHDAHILAHHDAHASAHSLGVGRNAQPLHDLMQKAVGWMLRELGKRDKDLLVQFLEKYAKVMPRTMLRYAIEKFPEEERKEFMKR